MESLVNFCALLCIGLGSLQLFLPNLIDMAEDFLNHLFNISDIDIKNARRISGSLLIIVGIVLFFISYYYDIENLI